MEISEARLAANRANAARSTGPTSERGKAVSRRNALKHGLAGSGVVALEGDQAEVDRRVEALDDELQPRSTLGSILIRKIATCSVRSERAAGRENAAVAERMRNAGAEYDERRGQRLDELVALLPDNPTGAVRNLRRMPEGVDHLIEGWRALRRDLGHPGMNRWGSPQMGRALNLAGIRGQDGAGTRIGDLSAGVWGDFHVLTPADGGDLDDDARRGWAKAELGTLIDARIAELEAHRATLDLERIEQDRREAPARLTFDDSKEATLARRYEAEADRGFYKALKEFRQTEAEARERAEVAPETPIADPPAERVGSFREPSPPLDQRCLPTVPPAENPPVRAIKGRRKAARSPIPPPA